MHRQTPTLPGRLHKTQFLLPSSPEQICSGSFLPESNSRAQRIHLTGGYGVFIDDSHAYFLLESSLKKQKQFPRRQDFSLWRISPNGFEKRVRLREGRHSLNA